VLAVLAPGQGAQKPGMLTDWLALPGAESFFRWAGAIADADLLTLGTTGDAEAIKDTAVTQPLVVAMSLFIARELGGLPGPVSHTPHAGRDVVITGHSVGELTAAALAGVLSIEAAIALTAVRGRAMAAACAQTPTGMSAVLGGEPDEVLAAIDKHGLTPANMNGAGQIVAAGSLDGLEALKADPPAKARIMPLSVAGAFHTDYMASAREELEGLIGGLKPAEPSRLLLSNADGHAVATGAETLARLVRQVTSPVRFDACLATMRELGVTAVLELPPAGALAGLAKREWKGHQVDGTGIEILALSSPADLDRARELIAAERGRAEAEHLPDWRVVVSPVRGTVSPAEVAEGSRLPAGTPLGSISSRREEVNVSAGYDGVLAEWLVHEGDLVDAGDPIARLYPEVSA
jgi:malonyl CoA-acyl carrier protein transacylase